jgi:CheY-like chemotaxis protein
VNEKETLAVPRGVAIHEARNRATLLVVEDEPAVRELTSAFLSSAGYKVVTAKDGLEAVQIAQKMGASLDGVLTDVVMPHMRGPELAEQVLQFIPGTRIIFMSGYPQHSETNPALGKKEFFVQKPFTRESLVLAVSQAMNSKPVRVGPYFSSSDKTI